MYSIEKDAHHMAAAKRNKKNAMTDAHKAALATGRTEGRVVREYLEALRANKPKRGRDRKSTRLNSSH